MRKIHIIILVLFIYTGCSSQENKIHYSSYIQSEFNYPDDIFLADSIYFQMLDTISKVAGLNGILIPLYETFDYGSFAVFDTEIYQRSIWINKSFFKDVYNKTKSKYATMSIMAHEFAHHLYFHPLEENPLYRIQELNADRHSGYLLRLLGAPKSEISLALYYFANEQETDTHPDRASRIDAIEQGWAEADLLINRAFINSQQDTVKNIHQDFIYEEVKFINEFLLTDTITNTSINKNDLIISKIKLNYSKDTFHIRNQNIFIENIKIGELLNTKNILYKYTFELFNEQYFIDINNIVWLKNPSGNKIQTGIAY